VRADLQAVWSRNGCDGCTQFREIKPYLAFPGKSKSLERDPRNAALLKKMRLPA
jgi:hypothetical protein